jgi:Flp pilus assembly protein TadG
MTESPLATLSKRLGGFLATLARDTAGNTLALIAAALIPLMAMVGGGVDVSRGYLAQSRLQQACDAGVLAARKRAGADLASGTLNVNAQDAGDRFFDINFADGIYGTTQRQFTMKVEADYSVSGSASVVVPTTIMSIFGYKSIPLNVTCGAKLDMPNTDVMMVLDVTGSMAETNPGDTQPKISILKQVVKDFYSQLEANKAPGTRTRYGFVPYSSNVNVGGLLKSDWMVDKTTVQVRVATVPSTAVTTTTYVSGSKTTSSPYSTSTCPESDVTWQDLSLTNLANGDKSGRTQADGKDYQCTTQLDGSVTVVRTTYSSYVFDWYMPKKVMGAWTYQNMNFTVKDMQGKSGSDPLTNKVDVKKDPLGLMTQYRGCIQERSTYQIGDYSNVDLTKALDLDIDLVPSKSKPATQWRPQLAEIYLEKTDKGKNETDLDKLAKNRKDLVAWWQVLAPPTCPNPAKKLTSMTSSELASYVDALAPGGNTYHDIGMIWGGRLISPTGLFASENGDIGHSATSRNLIMLTDGETATAQANLATYGIEPYDKRRWQSTSPLNLNKVVEKRFAVACDEVKKKNVTVWFIAFGTSLNPVMTACAGEGHYFEAHNAQDLSNAFATIARSIGDLRISK